MKVLAEKVSQYAGQAVALVIAGICICVCMHACTVYVNCPYTWVMGCGKYMYAANQHNYVCFNFLEKSSMYRRAWLLGLNSSIHYITSLYFCLDTQENASHIARAVSVEYESLGRPIVTTEDAIRANSYVENLEPSVIKVGDAKGKPGKTSGAHTHILKATQNESLILFELTWLQNSRVSWSGLWWSI